MATFGWAGSGPVVAFRERPVALLVANPPVGVLGTVVQLDATQSTNPQELPLTYAWEFTATPVGSKVSIEGFRNVNPDGSLVSFSPDITGAYTIQVTISDGVFESVASVTTSIQAILVPDGAGIVPDGKFIWSYIRDVWQQAENREVFETLWSALIQIVGTELLKLYQVDFNKSIKDIQDKFQRRWVCYEPRLDIDNEGATAILGTRLAGINASTEILGSSGKAVLITKAGATGTEALVVEGTVRTEATSPFRITYSKDPAHSNVGSYDLLGTTPNQSSYRLASIVPNPQAEIVHDNTLTPIFTFQSKTWSFGTAQRRDYALVMSEWPSGQDQMLPTYQPSSELAEGLGGALVGDVIVVASGINAGYYRITNVAGSYITVDRSPPSSSDGAKASIHRPVGYAIPASPQVVTNTLAIPLSAETASLVSLLPGRIMGVGGRGYTVLRTFTDPFQGVTLAIISTDDGELVAWQSGIPWRVPHCLVSQKQDFEALGVRPGDLLVFDVYNASQSVSTEVKVRVVAVDRTRLGFEFDLAPPTTGEVAPFPEELFATICNDLNIPTASYSARTGLVVSDAAAALWTYFHGTSFKSNYWNVELSIENGIETPFGVFYAKPRYVIRNSSVPVDSTVLDIPVLQEWINTPTVVSRDGKYYVLRRGKEVEVSDPPIKLFSNTDYVIDSRVALDSTFVYVAGSAILEIEGARFVDLRIAQGDVLTVHNPVGIAGDYKIAQVLSQERLKLVKPIPQGVSPYTSSRLTITRRNEGSYLRFLPGLFDAEHPLPARLWAEVSYFDNSDAIEDNFGLLVGLRKKDLEGLRQGLSYRQAVAGLMYAYSQGSSLDRVRLGSQILLGLPFAEHRGLIRAIDEDYRLDTFGTPIQGRLVIEDIDANGVQLGLQRIYVYPVDLESTDLAGIETNPATGRKYAVGDTVEQFSPLAKGVLVSDSKSDPGSYFSTAAAALQKHHSFRLKINDQIFGPGEIQLVSEFLRRITPSYVAFILNITSELVDQLSIEDQIYLKLLTGTLALAENVGLGLPAAFRFNDQDYSGHALGKWGTGVLIRRASGTVATLSNASNIITVSGGLLTVGGTTGHPCKVGDIFVLLSGLYAGPYTITDLTDTTATVDGPMGGFTAGQSAYFVYRPLAAELRRGVISAVATEAVPPDPAPDFWMATSRFTVETGLIADGVMPGDWMLVDVGATVERFTVVGVEFSEADDCIVRVQPSDAGVLASSDYRIYRPSFIPTPYLTATLVSTGTAYTSISDPYLAALMDPRDDLEAPEGQPTLMVLDPKNLEITPVLPAGNYTVKLRKQTSSSSAPVGFGWWAKSNVGDIVKLVAKGPLLLAETQNDGTIILGDFVDAVRVGDFIRLKSGFNVSTDIGYGPGIFPIIRKRNSPNNDVLVPSTLSADPDIQWELIKFFGSPATTIGAVYPRATITWE